MIREILIQIVAIVLLTMTISGCSTDETPVIPLDSKLEWRQTDSSNDGFAVRIQLAADEIESRVMNFRIAQTGQGLSLDETVTFEVDGSRSSAVEGEHIVFPGGTTATIPAGDTFSEVIPVKILPNAVQGNRDLKLVLSITDTGEISPSEERGELSIYISKILESFPVTTLKLQRPGYNNGTTMLDLDALVTYSRNEANNEEDIQRIIDFGFWSSTSRDYVFMTPTSYRLSAWGSGRRIQDEWLTENRNDGMFMKLPAGEANEFLFTEIQNRRDLYSAFDSARQRVSRLNTDDYGPNEHVHFIEEGEIIFFESFSRNIRAIMRVDAVSSGGSGDMDISVKRIIETN